ncbi:hypothetical protein [Actinomadura gamaensis]|uniref:Uncharacterized protein n=1 Tax=Actinomadura gamaensis TaxID=1763541 RepID=A0ABV9TYJ9_9ACTN
MGDVVGVAVVLGVLDEEGFDEEGDEVLLPLGLGLWPPPVRPDVPDGPVTGVRSPGRIWPRGTCLGRGAGGFAFL